ncbi:hypothetical protein PFICI_05265 [Pestalotiopsis fici W106-1]|uniref:C2H2-type domain-containing protein n=1 Tax=Pestalotiopsis fici (strain W106-1 / CGMCC3.15140) TaxID=1229662 RepID=W3XBI7_PESFW|nr:uncharacterized protein PFICI_05265 [Pestalotiopsis fici W106-1]ETS83389.1 hypothetical protein PFICI_05265 [Pestalotiopsis fici W106-1]
MTATAGPFAHDTFASDPSDPDGPIFRNSPPMTAYRPRLEPSLSPPPAIPLPKVSLSPTAGRKASNRKKKVQPSQGDAVLVHYLDGGRRPEIAAEAGAYPLDGGYCDDGVGGEEDDDDEDTDEEDEGDNHSRSSSMSGYIGSPKMSPDPRPTNGAMILKSLALAALEQQPSSPGADSAPKSAVMENDKVKGQMRSPPEEMIQLQEQQQQQQQLSQAPPPPPQVTHHPQLQPLQPRDMTTKPGLAMPITPYTPSVPEFCSPRLPSSSGLRHPDPMSPTSTPSNHGELAPIMASPTSETNGHTSQALPSIRAQVGDLLIEKHYPDKDNAWRRPSFPQSPPGLPGMSSIPGMTSPTSPQYPYTHSMPSPASVYTPHGSYPGSGFVPRSGQDYSGPTGRHPEAPVIMDHNNPLVSPVSRDRMSIDHMTNQVGSFVCTFAGCNAAPFQTQYLLNSHANVHSSARPHYCPVKGCPRSEGGKGFKRKNEMIRHGLVHESPGYVCPFCPDREHKYPRPDNLQRHVRVHHTDKDKDDPQLREVLAQRPDGPNRGRRRRGVP